MSVIETERLTLRPLVPADAEAYVAMRWHPAVARWLPTVPGDALEGARATIERFATGWRERRHAPWGVFLDGRLIGHGGLNFVPEFLETEVLWAFHPDAWGNGYATEVARAALAFGFDTLDLRTIFAITLPDNRPSQAVMRRIGLTYRRRVAYRGYDDIVWYDMSRDTWKMRRV